MMKQATLAAVLALCALGCGQQPTEPATVEAAPSADYLHEGSGRLVDCTGPIDYWAVADKLGELYWLDCRSVGFSCINAEWYEDGARLGVSSPRRVAPVRYTLAAGEWWKDGQPVTECLIPLGLGERAMVE